MTLPANPSSASSNARSVSTSRSLEGSSSKRTLAPDIRILARCSRPRSPPESCPTTFCWSAPLKLNRPRVGARGHRELDHGDVVLAACDLLEDRLVGREHVARLVDIGELHCLADFDFARLGFFLAGDHAEQRRLARAVRGRQQGVRRAIAHRQALLQGTAGRNRRRDRPERRGQVDAVPHDHRQGKTQVGQSQNRQDSAARLCRPVARRALGRQDGLRGDRRRPGQHHRGQVHDALARLPRPISTSRARTSRRSSGSFRAGSAAGCTWPRS